MKKILILVVSLAFIASIGVGGTLAYRTYLITNTIQPVSAIADLQQAPVPLSVQAKAMDEPVTVSALSLNVGSVEPASNPATDPNTPAGATMSITQHTLQRASQTDDAQANAVQSADGKNILLNQLLPSPAFQSGNPLPTKSSGGYWNGLGAVDHIVNVSYDYTVPAGSTAAAPDAAIHTVFAFPNPEITGNAHFMDKIYLNWANEENLTKYDGKSYTDFNINGKPYRVYTYNYAGTIASNSTTANSLLQVAMDASITNDDIALLRTAFPDGFAVKVASQAYTTDAGANPFGKVEASNHPWSGK